MTKCIAMPQVTVMIFGFLPHVVKTRGVRKWLSAFPFLPIPISFIAIPTSAKHFFPIPIIFPYIHSHSLPFPFPITLHQRLCGTINGNAYSTILHKTHHIAIALATQTHNTIIFNTIHHCVTEDINKSHYGPLCTSRKQKAQSVV